MNEDRRFYILIIIILALLLYFKGCGKSTEVKEILKYNYQTDTIFISSPFTLSKEIKTITPPKIITKYIRDTLTVYVEIIPDYILVKIKGLKDSLKISQQFLAQYPINSKLIEFNLNKDLFNITLLDTGANILTKEYPINLNHYKYEWYDNELHHKKINFKESNKKMDFKSLYLEGGYDFITLSPIMSLSYQLKFKRLKLSIGSDLLMSNNPQLILNTKLGLRLFK